jgi:hypothetical protein
MKTVRPSGWTFCREPRLAASFHGPAKSVMTRTRLAILQAKQPLKQIDDVLCATREFFSSRARRRFTC